MEIKECCQRHTVRDSEQRRALVNRLRRIEGQVRGVRGLLEEDAYCVDILTQVSAISSALTAFSRELLDSHIRGCVVEDIKNGDGSTVEELIKTVSRFMK